MSHYAKIENGIVTQVIVAEQDFIDSGAVGDPASWIQTSYNGTVRNNYAAIGYSYNTDIDAFVPPKPFPSWILNTDTATWKAPIDQPVDDKHYIWNEDTTSWIETQNPSPITGVI